MYDRFEINSDALRNSLGYSADAEPDNKEIAKQILLQLVRSGQPDLTNYAINSLRDKFGLKDLPKIEPPEAPASPGPGAPKGPVKPETAEPGSNVPGERSQNKQTSPPPTPEIGDNSNNEVK